MKVLCAMEDKNLKKKKVLFTSIAIFIGLLLILPKDITWAKDRLNYFVYASDSINIISRRYSAGIFSFLTNEPLFLMINIILSFIFSPKAIIKIIIFSSVIGVLYSLGKLSNYNLYVLLLFVFVPQILKNHITHLRQGLALSFYLVGLTSSKKYGKIIKYSSAFIHTSFAFILLFEFLEIFFKKIKFDSTLRILVSSICLTLFIFTIPSIAMIFGDRRALEYNFEKAGGASGIGLLIWLLVGGFFILTSKKEHINIIICYGIIFYIVSYYFLDFSVRIFENILPLLMTVTVIDSRKKIRIMYILFFLTYGGLQWYIRGGINF